MTDSTPQDTSHSNTIGAGANPGFLNNTDTSASNPQRGSTDPLVQSLVAHYVSFGDDKDSKQKFVAALPQEIEQAFLESVPPAEAPGVLGALRNRAPRQQPPTPPRRTTQQQANAPAAPANNGHVAPPPAAAERTAPVEPVRSSTPAKRRQDMIDELTDHLPDWQYNLITRFIGTGGKNKPEPESSDNANRGNTTRRNADTRKPAWALLFVFTFVWWGLAVYFGPMLWDLPNAGWLKTIVLTLIAGCLFIAVQWIIYSTTVRGRSGNRRSSRPRRTNHDSYQED